MLQPDKWKLHLENESTSWLISQKNESKKSRSQPLVGLLHGAAEGGGTRDGKLDLDTRYPVNLPSEKKKPSMDFYQDFLCTKNIHNYGTKYETLASSQMACLLGPAHLRRWKTFSKSQRIPSKAGQKFILTRWRFQRRGTERGITEWRVTEDSPPGKTKKDDGDGRVCYAQKHATQQQKLCVAAAYL